MPVISLLPIMLTSFISPSPKIFKRCERYCANRATPAEITCVVPSVAPDDQDYKSLALNKK